MTQLTCTLQNCNVYGRPDAGGVEVTQFGGVPVWPVGQVAA